MAWTYSAGILTSTGGTEGSPDSLLAGIDVVEAADPTKGYRNGFGGWLNDVEVRAGGSFIIIDDDAQIELLGASFIDPSTGGVIHGSRSTLIISVNTNRIDTALSFATGSTLIARRDGPYDPSPRIVHNTTVRYDYPTIIRNDTPSKVDIQGLDLYGISGSHALKMYFGRATESAVNNIRKYGAGTSQFFATTYDDYFQEGLTFASESAENDVIFNRPSFYAPTPTFIRGIPIRSARATFNNPTFLNDCWDGTIDWRGDAPNFLAIYYTFEQQFKQGLLPLDGVNVRFSRAQESATGTIPWVAPNATVTAVTDAQGEFPAVSLLDAYREGLDNWTVIERFNWTCKARSYDKRTAGETVFLERVLYQGSVNLSAGYSEEVQMLGVNGLTLTQAQAAALTGISFSASGATGGTVTITESRTTAEVWAAYRNWISQIANFDSEDSWLLTGNTLDLGAWDIVIDGATVTGSLSTTGAATFQNGGAVTGSIVDANGVLASINGLDPQALGTEWTLGYITEANYQARDQNAAPATWTGWAQINGTGNTAQVQLAQDTAYRLFHRAPGYDNTTEATVDTGETFSTVMTPIADRDLQGALLWPQTAAHATQAAKFTYNAVDGLVDYDNQTGSTDYIPFLAGYRAFGNIVYSPALTFSLRFLPRVNATKDGFVLDPDATLTLRMSDASDASAILEADVSYTNGQKAYDRFVANANHLFLLYAQMSEVLSSSSVQQVASAVDQSAVLAKEATVATRASQTSVDAIPTNPLLADAYTAPDNATIATINTKVQTLTNGPTLAEIEASSVLAKETSLEGLATAGQVGTPLQAGDYTAPDNEAIATINTVVQASNVDIAAIKAKTDAIRVTGGLVETVAKTVEDKAGYSLTQNERSAVATAVEAALLDDGDGQQLIDAIVLAIGNQNLDQIAVIAGIRADLEREGGKLDQTATSAQATTINEGVKKASVLVPHFDVLPQ